MRILQALQHCISLLYNIVTKIQSFKQQIHMRGFMFEFMCDEGKQANNIRKFKELEVKIAL